MDLQPIFNIAQLCHQKGIQDIVLSPGSRCAPLTLAFTRHPKLKCRIFSDERSAAFIANGMSLQSKTPSVLVCTSGSAAYNYAPAVAEAYFQQIPVIIFTADRPPEWIDQLDGQTIRQHDIYGKHVKHSYEFPVELDNDDAKWHANRIVDEAINLAQEFPQGPVHINIPFREPFYPDATKSIEYTEVKISEQFKGKAQLSSSEFDIIKAQWGQFNRILIVGGQSEPDNELTAELQQLSDQYKVPVIGDIISNLHSLQNCINRADIFLAQQKSGFQQSVQPDLLITFGKSVISKNLKLFLRKHQPAQHWHISPAGYTPDTFKSLTRVIRSDVKDFFKLINATEPDDAFGIQKQENYYHIWQIENRKTERLIREFFPSSYFGEFDVVQQIIHNLPENCNLHLANSMAVRYANIIGILPHRNDIQVFANRGTSGIDGSNSTAVGAALTDSKLNVLITGDMAFFYDRNAFWHNYDLPNLRIIVLNNHAGGIFRMIKGPSDQPELEEFFETRQSLTAKYLTEEYGYDYIHCKDLDSLQLELKEFYSKSENVKIMEVENDSKENKKLLEEFKLAFENIK